jgi:cytochrome c oxidase subunit II
VRRHPLTRLVAVWVVLTAIAVPVLVYVLGPHMPPYRGSNQASDQTTANIVLIAIMVPIMLGVWLYFGYALIAFRRRDRTDDGPPIKGNPRLQLGWVGVTTVIVLVLAGYGTYALYATAPGAQGAGAGGGQGPEPLAVPSGAPLQVQVIAQQWHFTYRYPSYGGVETFKLRLPAGVETELHVTSLDVIHSFWAYQLGVKADAVPGADNVAFVTPRRPQTFSIRCAELCGLWHGHMSATGVVLDRTAFDNWIKSQERKNRLSTHYLPRYAGAYYPQPYARAG